MGYKKQTGRADWCDTCLGNFYFENQVVRYDLHLHDKMGTSQRRKCIITIEKMLRVLDYRSSITKIEDITADHLTDLSDMMSELSIGTRNRYIGFLVDFVEWSTGQRLPRPYPRRETVRTSLPEAPGTSELESQLSRFIEDQRERGLSETTLKNLRKCVRASYSAIIDEYGPISPDEIDYTHLRRIRHSMQARQNTIQAYLCNFGKFLGWCYGYDPYKRAGLVFTGDVPDRTWITMDQWRVLFEAADETTKVILALGAMLGLRLSEITHIRLSDFKEGRVKIRGKGSKIALINVQSQLDGLIAGYLGSRAELLGDRDEDHLLVRVARDGNVVAADDHWVQRMLQELSLRTGIPFSCHTLRRFFCSTMVDAGVPLYVVQNKMRHAQINTTLRHYVYVNPQRSIEVDEMLANQLLT